MLIVRFLPTLGLRPLLLFFLLLLLSGLLRPLATGHLQRSPSSVLKSSIDAMAYANMLPTHFMPIHSLVSFSLSMSIACHTNSGRHSYTWLTFSILLKQWKQCPRLLITVPACKTVPASNCSSDHSWLTFSAGIKFLCASAESLDSYKAYCVTRYLINQKVIFWFP